MTFACRRLRRGMLAVIAVVGGCFATVAPAQVNDARLRIVEGNLHFAAGRFEEAMAAYDAARQAAAAASPELLHNLAAAHFKLRQYDAARDLWVRLKEAGDPAMEARSRYNLGNCDYAEALGAMQQDPQRAMDLLSQAGEQFRSAVRLDPSLTDARANLELAHRLRREIEKMLENQPQSQSTQSSQPSKEQQDDTTSQPSNQDKERQDPQEQQPSEPKDPPSGPPDEQPPDPQDAQSQADDDQQQDESSRESDEPSDEQAQPQDESQDEQTQGERDEARDAPSPGADQQPASGQPEDKEAPAARMTREQAERLLQKIRDAEKARRERLARQQAAQQKPVERDW